MSGRERDPIYRIAEQVADYFRYSGYAFVEEGKIDGLAAMLQSFLAVADIPVNSAYIGDLASAADQTRASSQFLPRRERN